MPHTHPPITCDRAVLALSIRPAPVTATWRCARTIPVNSLTQTSEKFALKAWLEYLESCDGFVSTRVWYSFRFAASINWPIVGAATQVRFDFACSSVLAWLQASLTELEKLAAPIEPTEPAAGGSVESPSFTPTFSIGNPNVSAAV